MLSFDGIGRLIHDWWATRGVSVKTPSPVLQFLTLLIYMYLYAF